MMTQMNSNTANTAVSEQLLAQLRHSVKDTLAQVMGTSSPEMLDEMATIYLEDAIPLIDQMKEGLNQRDYSAITMAAHALKGSSATIGLTAFADLCLAVETSSKENQADRVSAHLIKLESEYPKVQRALEGFLQ